jgi:hypothetical protein
VDEFWKEEKGGHMKSLIAAFGGRRTHRANVLGLKKEEFHISSER